LNFEEFNSKIEQMMYVSATPAPYELSVSDQTVLQLIRPTGLLDPPVEVRPLKGQIDDLMEEVRICAGEGNRVLVTTLTKRTAEDLSQYLRDAGLRVEYLHSDVVALERIEILSRLRKGEFDALIGINLLREGLDLPEVALVAVLDADKEGFLRSATSLIQTAGRTARHESGRVILYADVVTESMRTMIGKTESRRERQIEFNKKHGITPKSVRRTLSEDDAVRSVTGEIARDAVAEIGMEYDLAMVIEEVKREMMEAANALEFERAAVLRDELLELHYSCNTKEIKVESAYKKQSKRKR
jgi:excinuclease ABC subunit B